MDQLLKKYAPRTLDEVLGQPRVVAALQQFVAAPYPAAFLFFGESGVGKSATAAALAVELGGPSRRASWAATGACPRAARAPRPSAACRTRCATAR
jgi:DNA polymerase III gamma/tau subunit